MTAVGDRPRAREKAASRGRHPASRVAADGRGPRRSEGRPTGLFWVLFVATVGLVALGAVMGLSASAAVSVADTDSAWSLFRRQAVWVGIGLAVMFAMMRIDYRHWRRPATPLLATSVALLFVVKPAGLGDTLNGATRWITVAGLRMQPSELAKFALIVFIAELLSRPGRSMANPISTMRPVIVVSAVVVGLLFLQPHLGAIVIIVVVVGVMLYLGGAPVGRLASFGAAAVVLAGLMVWRTPWRRDRVLAFLDPLADPDDAGYQTIQALGAITEGGWRGLGLGGSYAKYGFLPYAHTDFIFAIVAEELGLIGTSAVIVGFVAIGVAGIVVATRAPDRFGLLLAVGITTWVVVQAVLNIGAVLSLLPVAGVTLPFLSFGGSSLVATLAAMGLLLNIARQAR